MRTRYLLAMMVVPIAVLLGCGTSARPTVTPGPSTATSILPTTVATTASTVAPTTVTAGAMPAPAPPNNLSGLETATAGLKVSTRLLMQELGEGSGTSQVFTPTGAVAPTQQHPSAMGMARLLVEWSCAPGSAVTNVHVVDGSGEDITGSLKNGFDGPFPVDNPPVKVVWAVQGSCGWHVRALDQAVTQ